MQRCLHILFLFFGSFLFGQNSETPHAFKLPGNSFNDIKYRTENGVQIPDKYEKIFKAKEDKDSVIYFEFYDHGKHWNVYRYIVENKKTYLSGWQKEYDDEGRLYTERFCEKGERKCKIYRSYTYYPGGRLMSNASYLGNDRDGNHFYYYTNGQLRECMEFENDRLLNVLAYYDQEGNALEVGNFCDGEGMVNIYSMNGRIIQRKLFHKGKVKKVFAVPDTN
ncbi:MAG: hypothetical protein H7X71_02340 [Chitinophagales bacterium]|nr:hypothetical protein [Chitinophagales bacterium]